MSENESNSKSIFAACSLLKLLAPASIHRIYEQSEKITFTKRKNKQDNIIFERGDAGDCLYILIEGTVDIVNISIDGKEDILNQYHQAGDYFGVQSLIDSLKNRTTRAIISSDTCVLIKVNKKEFDEIILAEQEGLYDRLNDHGNKFLQKDSLVFSQFLSQNLHDRIKEETIEGNDFIFKAGEAGDRFYLILDGVAQVFKGDVLIAELTEGGYFGAYSLIENRPHETSVKATKNLKVVSIAGDDFLKLYKSSSTVQVYIEKMHNFTANDKGIIYSEHQSNYKNLQSITTVLTYPNGESCSITRVIANSHQLKIVKQIDTFDRTGAFICKKDALLVEEDRLITTNMDTNAPLFYVKNNHLIGVELSTEYAYLGNIIPTLLSNNALNLFQRALYKEKGQLWIKGSEENPSDSAVICSCMGTTRGELKELTAFGFDSYDKLANKTGASKACGFCVHNVAEIAETSANRQSADIVNSLTDNISNEKGDIKFFRFKPKNSDVECFLPGQHIRVQAKIKNQYIERAYTLTSDASQNAYYEIAVRKTDKGVFSHWLHDKLDNQSDISISKPQGTFHLIEGKNPVVCFVAGVGITPAIAFLRYFISTKKESPLIIDYSLSSAAEGAFLDELSTLSESWYHFNKRITAGGNRLTESDVRAIVEKNPDADYFICGGNAYSEAVQEHLTNCHIEADKIHSEHFDNSQKNPVALLSTSILILLATLLFYLMPSVSIPSSVIDPTDWVKLLPKDITGYSIVVLGVLGLLIALPRRWAWVRLLDSSTWRLIHIGLGVVSLIFLFFHTGFSMGGGFAQLLMSDFLILFILGAGAGISIASQMTFSPAQTYRYKKYFRWLHIGFSWPLPALLLMHILSTYIDMWI